MEDVALTERAESEKRRILDGIRGDLKGQNYGDDTISQASQSQVDRDILNRSLGSDMDGYEMPRQGGADTRGHQKKAKKRPAHSLMDKFLASLKI